jgi:hypothetical protein
VTPYIDIQSEHRWILQNQEENVCGDMQFFGGIGCQQN